MKTPENRLIRVKNRKFYPKSELLGIYQGKLTTKTSNLLISLDFNVAAD